MREGKEIGEREKNERRRNHHHHLPPRLASQERILFSPSPLLTEKKSQKKSLHNKHQLQKEQAPKNNKTIERVRWEKASEGEFALLFLHPIPHFPHCLSPTLLTSSFLAI